MTDTVDKKNILIVDDAPENIDVLKNILSETFGIKAAINGEKGWKILDSGASVDLVLLDINMPVMDGWELCQKIKADNRLSEIPVIFITASQDSEAESKGFELGAADFITKPFAPTTVLTRVKAHITLYDRTTRLHHSLEELQRTQDELVESQKMASLGSLAAGVAHEINTPVGITITAISSLIDRTENLKTKMQESSLKKSDMETYLSDATEAHTMIRNSMQKTAKLVESFKAFSLHDADEEPELFPIEMRINEIIRKVRHDRKTDRIQAICNCTEDTRIRTYPTIFCNIVESLIDNAIEHGIQDKADGIVTVTCEGTVDSVKVTVEDNGKGISGSEIQQIFQPFYTTKRIKGFSGLGLSTVHNLIYHKLQGKIEVHSEEGKGSKFIITLAKNLGS